MVSVWHLFAQKTLDEMHNPILINSRCYTSSCTSCLEHTFNLLAGVSGLAQNKYYSQVQAIARPANASDPKLKLWIKSPAPVIAQPPPNGLAAQFRDPTTAWRQVGF